MNESNRVEGRDEHLRRLSTAWEEVRAGGAAVRLVSGAMGVGKSRLLRSLREDVVGDDGLILRARGLPSTRGSEWSTLGLLLQGISEAPGLGEAPDAALARVAAVAPAIRDRFPRLPPSEPQDPIAMGTALARVLAVVASGTPVLLEVDDLPDVDTSTLLTLTELFRRAPAGVMALVATHEVESEPELSALLHMDHVEEVSLRSLEGKDLAAGELEPVADRDPVRRGPRRRGWIAGVVVAAILVALAVAFWPGSEVPPSPPDGVAVFTFGYSGSPESAWLGEGVAELLSAGLDGLVGLRTLDRHALTASSSGAPGTPAEADEIARRLGADRYVLGTVVESGGQVQLQASVHGPGDAGSEVVETARMPSFELFEGVDELARGLVPLLVPDPSPDRVAVASPMTGSVEALRAFLDGETAFRTGRYERALDAYRRALARDSVFALAHQRVALALEWSGEAAPSQVREQLERARRGAESLPSRDRALLDAVQQYHLGESAQSEAALRTLLVSDPEFVDGWFALGNTLFHGAPRAGRPDALVEAREVFERILAMNSEHGEALLRLLRLSATRGDREAMIWQLEALRDSPLAGSPVLVPSEALAAWGVGDPDRIEESMTSLERSSPSAAFLSAAFVATYGSDAEGAAQILESRTGPGHPPGIRAAAHLWRAGFLRADGGSPEAVRAELSRGRDLAPRLGALYLGLHLAHPDERAEPDTVAIADLLAGWPVGSTPADGGIPSLTEHPGLEPVLDLYVEGLLRTRVGESGAVADILERLGEMEGPDVEADRLRRSLMRGLEAELHLAAARYDQALAALEGVHFETWHPAAFSSPFHALSRERYLMAVALDRAGRSREAREWYRSVGMATPHDALYRSAAGARERTLSGARPSSTP